MKATLMLIGAFFYLCTSIIACITSIMLFFKVLNIL